MTFSKIIVYRIYCNLFFNLLSSLNILIIYSSNVFVILYLLTSQTVIWSFMKSKSSSFFFWVVIAFSRFFLSKALASSCVYSHMTSAPSQRQTVSPTGTSALAQRLLLTIKSTFIILLDSSCFFFSIYSIASIAFSISGILPLTASLCFRICASMYLYLLG
jgi:hypothetical protein